MNCGIRCTFLSLNGKYCHFLRARFALISQFTSVELWEPIKKIRGKKIVGKKIGGKKSRGKNSRGKKSRGKKNQG